MYFIIPIVTLLLLPLIMKLIYSKGGKILKATNTFGDHEKMLVEISHKYGLTFIASTSEKQAETVGVFRGNEIRISIEILTDSHVTKPFTKISLVSSGIKLPSLLVKRKGVYSDVDFGFYTNLQSFGKLPKFNFGNFELRVEEVNSQFYLGKTELLDQFDMALSDSPWITIIGNEISYERFYDGSLRSNDTSLIIDSMLKTLEILKK